MECLVHDIIEIHDLKVNQHDEIHDMTIKKYDQKKPLLGKDKI